MWAAALALWVRLVSLASFIPGAGLISGAVSLGGAALRFLATPLGQIAAAALAVVLAFYAGDFHRWRLDKAQSAQTEIARAQAQKQRDETIQKSVSAAAAAQIAQLQQQADALQSQVDDYAHELAARPAACQLTPDDIRRLRKL